MDWNALTCVVTGASSGIGREIASSLARRGATVIAVARRQEKLAALVQELGGAPHSYVVCDVSEIDQVRAMAEAVAGRSPKVDILVNSVGIPGPGRVVEASAEEVEKVLRVNLVAPIWCIQALFPLIAHAPRDGRTPVIVNVASMSGRIPIPSSSPYTASKFGMVGFTESFWAEMHDKGVQVMVVNPGFVHTEGFPMDHLLGKWFLRWMVMKPEAVAEATCRGISSGRTEVRVQRWWSLVYYQTVAMGPLRRRVSHAVWSAVGGRQRS
jgi:short-subunit dehydrogenase